MDEGTQIGEARRFAALLCAALEFHDIRQGRVGIIVNELANNLVRYAPGGQLFCRLIDGDGQQGVELISVDRGSGLDASVVLQDGYTTGTTPGTGLGAVQRLADEFDIYSQRDKGTVVLARVYARDDVPTVHGKFEHGAVSIPMRGEILCGDGWGLRQEGGKLHAMVVDGLGHGPNANKAALEAIDVFQRFSLAATPDQLLQAIHGRLKSTRGGAVFVLGATAENVDFAGAGNIRAVLQHIGQTKTLISQNGTAGVQIRTLRTMSQAWDGRGYLIMHSDGVSSGWDLAQYPKLVGHHPGTIASLICRDFSRGNDDATVLVMRRRL